MRQLVSNRFELGECGGAGAGHGPRQQFGVAQRVGNAMSGQRVLEVAGIADQSPAWSAAASEEAALTTESANWFHARGTGHDRRQARELAQQSLVLVSGVGAR